MQKVKSYDSALVVEAMVRKLYARKAELQSKPIRSAPENRELIKLRIAAMLVK